MHIQELYKLFLQHSDVQTDSRKLKGGELFFALKGPNFNGNLFALEALEKGASHIIIDEDPGFQDERLILVTNVLETLQALAKYHRQQFGIPFIAITGSNGKTTTKELLHEVLSTTYKTYTTKGNLNNHIGIPLTILSVKKDAAIAIVEMGANHQKEIEAYCTYTLPTHGIITNVGKAHLEGFGGEEGIRKGKGELYDFLRTHDGTIFWMHDYAYLEEMGKGIIKKISYGSTNEADLAGFASGKNALLEVIFTKGTSIKNIQTNLVGNYNLPNVLAAVAVGIYFQVPEDKIKSALEQYTPSNSRSQLIEKDSNKIILDAYNANPSSMKAAIENMTRMEGKEKILLLGGMMELGQESIAEHEAILKFIEQYSWKKVVLVGGDYKKIRHPFLYFDNSAEARQWFRQQHFKDTTILIKGSRSIQMEKVLE